MGHYGPKHHLQHTTVKCCKDYARDIAGCCWNSRKETEPQWCTRLNRVMESQGSRKLAMLPTAGHMCEEILSTTGSCEDGDIGRTEMREIKDSCTFSSDSTNTWENTNCY